MSNVFDVLIGTTRENRQGHDENRNAKNNTDKDRISFPRSGDVIRRTASRVFVSCCSKKDGKVGKVIRCATKLNPSVLRLVVVVVWRFVFFLGAVEMLSLAQ